LGHANPILNADRQARNDLLAASQVTQQGTVIRGQFKLPVQNRPHNARDWGMTTHFPSDSRTESIPPA